MATFSSNKNNKNGSGNQINYQDILCEDLENYAKDLYMDENEIDSNKLNTFNHASIYDRGEVPESHRRLADSYMIVKKIYGNPVVQCKITKEEAEFLEKYNFKPLSECNNKEMEEELFLLRKWKTNGSKVFQNLSEMIINIRIKELKTVVSRTFINSGAYEQTGYKVLETYLENISKYKYDR